MANQGINRLARVLDRRIRNFCEKPPPLDFGTIQNDMSLLLDKFPRPIPQKDYMVCRSVQWGAIDHIFFHTQYPGKDNSGMHMHGENGEHPHGQSGEHAGHSGGAPGTHGHPGSEGAHNHPEDEREMEHIHDTLIGQKFRWLMPGDRVLVAWAGDDAVVVDLIFPATRIGRDADGYEK